jgi:hypothetical protein
MPVMPPTMVAPAIAMTVVRIRPIRVAIAIPVAWRIIRIRAILVSGVVPIGAIAAVIAGGPVAPMMAVWIVPIMPPVVIPVADGNRDIGAAIGIAERNGQSAAAMPVISLRRGGEA